MISKSRVTKETDITIGMDINGSGKSNIDSGVGFLDHMLESFSKHSLIDLDIKCKGDTHIDYHHSVEDIGIVMGSLFAESVYPVRSMERFGSANIVMDEACVSCDLDISNRPYLHYEVDLDGKIGTFDVELAEEFFRAFVINARVSAHIVVLRGKNKHHIVEAAFKSLAVALRRAMAKNEKIAIPSTKDVL
ncbi:MAG: imidazoleglycerol-phosphate dehydratase HisB [Sulfurimonas sp.]|jgi:imidazoleglycerol-phosphate dehydratase|nr:imidazoleglycerol-phosphate dehydratase HisB [Sulfurimonadaceae bacterium]